MSHGSQIIPDTRVLSERCLYNKQTNKRLLRDTEFLGSRSTRHLIRSLRSLVRNRVELSKRNSKSLRANVLFSIKPGDPLDAPLLKWRAVEIKGAWRLVTKTLYFDRALFHGLGEYACKLERVAKVACRSDGDLVNHLNISIYIRNK